MDDMDIDNIEVVPETPPARITGKSHLSSDFPENHNLRDGASQILFEAKNNGFGKFSGPVPKSFTSSSSVPEQNTISGLGNPRSVNEGILDHVCYANPTKNNKKFCAQLPASEGGPTVNTKERGFGADKKILPCEVPGNIRAEQTRKRVPVVIDSSSSHSNAGSPTLSEFANKGKEAENSSSGLNKKSMATLTLNNRPRVSGQKRLVKNGCISPLNIARTRESVGKEKVESDVQLNYTFPATSNSSHNSISGKEGIINDLVTLNSKGKEVMNSPTTVKEARSSNLSRRNSVSISEIVKEDANTDKASIRRAEENSGWRSTRNQITPTSFSSFHENLHKSSKNEFCLISESPTNVLKTGDRMSPGISDRHPINLDVTPTQNAGPPDRRSELGQVTRRHAAASGVTKRPKQQLTSSRNGESSRAASDSPDVVVIGSSNARRSRTRLNSEVPVIEVDESSSVARGSEFSNQGSNSTDADALAKQMEADEILARELQEQFYNEGPSMNMSEILGHFEMSRDFDLPQSFSRTGRNGSNAAQVVQRRSSVASLSASSSRQPITSSTPTVPRRVSQSRASSVSRLNRWRTRLPGHPRASASSVERGPMFPIDMDVDMRMNILEALEAFSDSRRDFNASDYELLLALDENIHHGGASVTQINDLPQSTVQSENFDEVCAVCLETPTIGDVIRHLPCLHKFHKDCIDPWLNRKTSCPVCKSSIT